MIAYPTLWCKSKGQVIKAVAEFAGEIHEQATDPDNYGLLFYACGYEGRLQTETKQNYKREGIEVI